MQGYGTERHIHNGPYNDILPWEYSKIPEVIGGGKGFVARTEDELDSALLAAKADSAHINIIDARLDPMDRSPALERLSRAPLEKDLTFRSQAVLGQAVLPQST